MRNLSPDQARAVQKLMRRHLNPMEGCELLEMFVQSDFKQQEIAELLGYTQPWVANMLRLRACSPFVQQLLLTGALKFADGRALASLPHPIADELAKRKIENRWTTRELEIAASEHSPHAGKRKPRLSRNENLPKAA